MSSKLFVESLIEDSLITSEQIKNLGNIDSKELSILLSQLYISSLIKDELLAQKIAAFMGYEYVVLDYISINSNVVDGIPYNYAEKNGFFPIDEKDGVMQIAFSNPCNSLLLYNLSAFTGNEIKILVASLTEIRRFQQRYFSSVKAGGAVTEFEQYSQKSALAKSNDMPIVESPTTKLFHTVIERAVAGHASDIHIEPFENDLLIRERINGDLRVVWQLKKEIHQELIGRIKILSGVDTAETRLPQDGHFKLVVSGETVDFRVGIMPSSFGEKAAIRILYRSDVGFSIDNLGFTNEDLQYIDNILQAPNGVIVICGPTGSGKTTTLAAFLQRIKCPELNIITIEDPIEQYIPHITQIQINNKIGNTFASLLRACLRQDPDIIMIGEMRDEETAGIALRGAITGHLVLTSLHTNDALGSISRLYNLNIEPYIIADSLTAILYQRLMKEICPNCKVPTNISDEDAKIIDLEVNSIVYIGEGCNACDHTGYNGRFCVSEILVIDDKLREMIQAKSAKQEMYKYAVSNGFVPIRKKAALSVFLGCTSISEYKRVFGYV